MIKIIVVITAGLLSIACADISSLLDDLNKRNVSSCIWYQGSYGPFFQVHGVTATGSQLVEDCQSLQR